MNPGGMIALALTLLLAGCAALNKPLNLALSDGANVPLVEQDRGIRDGVYVGLAFSGGGMRASAFAHGVLEELRALSRSEGDADGVLSDVRLVTGVSGGSVTAAHFGLYGPGSVDGYREKYLITNAEKYMANSPLNPLTLVRGLSGGANGRKTFGRYLDETLFRGATFGDLRRRSKIQTWINATDVANKVTFLFSPETFDALCSDLSEFPLSDAVAASAAFPLVFSPIVLEAHSGQCDYQEPDWLTAARHNPEATAAMVAHAEALESYASGEEVKYLKLLDGGITDNFGTTGLAVERARAQTPYAPLSAADAVRMRRMLFLVADAGTRRDLDWTSRLRGPGGVQLAMSIANSSMGAASRTGYDAMRLQLSAWERDLVEYRCALGPAEVRRLRGSLAGWDCKDVKFFVGQVSFRGLPDDMRDELDEIPTRLKLPVEQVDLAIEAGRLSTRQNAEVQGFLRAAGFIDTDALLAGRGDGPAPRRIAPIRKE
ncbi:patatin-like phospholipase family protein [Primorskyibacter aestuariivivens]|uniref:patatin-like phospholipase family protein n=1 Tax=Primorskyibacter aestuariivivens TaxID=1888912 RepID=UPI002300105A|nr:patatin-like phospholipase family protein [Primorskyibacter aestuariivivens]MDA7427398.1 patatin-like phospholipase family protein [Primorskyibacter aestuariivivens]